MNSWFSNCSNLESITIPLNIKTIEHHTFDGCTQLKNVEISEGVEEIDGYCFGGCKNLKKLVLPTTIKELEKGWDIGMNYGKTGNVTEIIFKGHEDWKIPKGYRIESLEDGKLNIKKCFPEGDGYPAKIRYFSTEEMLDEIK